MSETLRSGRIVYTNDLPVYAAFDHGVLPYPGVLHADIPSRLNAMVSAGELDVSPVSAAHYLANARDLVLLPDVCIGSRSDVWSVVLVSPIGPERLGGASVAITNHSASGRGLLQILFERRYGVKVTFVSTASALEAAKRGEPALVIGDEAIDARLTVPFWHVYDLGRVWHEWTGGDMVYAVWVARREAYEAARGEVEHCVRALRTAREWSAGHMDAVIADAQHVKPRAANFYRAYYETLNFNFDAPARAGLARFARELLQIGAIERVPELESEVASVAR